jgi:hypothetical protein
MKLERRHEVEASSGTLRVAVDVKDGEAVEYVHVHEEDAEPICMSAETLERAALMLQRARFRAGDFRFCCADHGYYDTLDAKCPACKPAVREVA